jgi:regulator of protease activity HflC (stomatin/prohibitin superfamily)
MGGISAILGILSFVGFVIFVVGVGTVVLAVSQGRPIRNGFSLAAVGLVIGVIFSIISQGIILVGPSDRAVMFNTVNGGLDPNELLPGTHIIAPIFQQATVYSIAQREYTMSGSDREGAVQGNDAVDARTSDGQVVSIDLTIFYRIDPNQVDKVHVDWQDRFENSFIRPTARGVVRDVIAQFTAEQIYSSGREQLGTQLRDQIAQRLTNAGFELTDLSIRNITFSETFTQAIENKTASEQEAQRAQIVVRQREQEAAQARAVAQGERDAAIARAQGEAQSIILRSQAQAEALRLVSEQIAANPNLIQYQYIQNLADNVRIMLVPSNSPFLFDFNQLTAANPDFTAPAVPQSDFDANGLAEATPEAGS